MNNNIDIGENICKSVDTIVTERLRTVNFDATVVCTIIDDSQKEQGTYIVSNGSTKFTAYTTDTKLKKDQQVYVIIPNNDYGEQKMILGKKTTENSSEPYVYNPPFNNFVKGSSNLVTMTSNDYLGLTANSDYEPPDPNSQEVKTQPLTRVPIAVDTDLPTTEIPFTRIGIKANFKSLLPASTIQGNYGVRFIANTVNGKQGDEALDCGDFYGNPYQFFNYINQEQVFVIPPDWGAINGIVLEFFQDNNFNLDEPEKIDEDLSWIQDSMGESITNDNNLFVSGVELYLGYDVGDFEEDNFKIYSTDNEYNYTNTNGERTSKTIKGEWVFIGEETENSTIISADALPYDKETYNPLKKNILLSNGKYINMLCWEKGTNEAGRTEYQGVRWYRQKYGAPKPDTYAGSGWEILDPADTENELYKFISPLELQVFLRTNTAEENYKCIVFDQLTFAQSALEPEEGKENKDVKEDVEQAERPFRVDTCVPIVSNTLSFVNEGYEKSVSYNKQTQLTITTTDDEDGSYYCYNLSGGIENDNWSRESRTLEIYYENILVDKNTKCKVEWIVPVRHSMFLDKGYKILGMDLDTINTGDKKSWINVQALNQQKQPIASSDSVFYRRITIDNLEGQALANLSNEENPFILTYQISSRYSQTNINNNIDCKLYYRNDNVPYTTSRKFNFGLNSTSGTEVVVQLQCKELEWGASEDKIIGYHPIIKLGQGKQIFRVTPQIIISNSREELKAEEFEIIYSWYGRNDQPKCFSGNTGMNGDNSYELYVENAPNSDEYIVLQMTMKYNETSGLTAYLPFAFSDKVDDNNYAELPDGVFEVIYDSASGLPFNTGYNIPYLIDNIDKNKIQWNTYVVENGVYTNTKDVEERPYYPSISVSKDKLSTLVPSSFYTDGLKKVSVRATDNLNGQIYWSQPLLILKNKFPNSLINKWDGNLLTDEENNSIMSAMMAAGSKDEQNRFSGVLMGAIQGESEDALAQHGLYGYQAGEQSFAFKEDGTAFIGKSGKGRIEFDGNKSTIKSAGYDYDQGIEIDLDDNYILSKSYSPFAESEEEFFAFIKIVTLIRMGEEKYIEDDENLSLYLNKLYEKCNVANKIINNLISSTNYILFSRKANEYITELSNYYINLEPQETVESKIPPLSPQGGQEFKEKNIFSKALKDQCGLEKEIRINGQSDNSNQALVIGESADPSFQVDWDGNTTITGDFIILNSEGKEVFSITKNGMIINPVGDSSTKNLTERIADLEDNNKAQQSIETVNGYSFSNQGLLINGSGNNITTLINHDGMKIGQQYKVDTQQFDQSHLVINHAGVEAKNLHASTYLKLGEHMRLEEYKDQNEDRVGCFWIG